ncbi:Tic20 family protein [Leptolyngbya sp. AN02str]|uniref:Tic20 family protein n=1 Tax=Leptolyngbya sp. AN02str TaxID=3423363 RepID=UPI003D31CBF9
MSWRSSTTPTDRLFGCLVYLLPLLDSLNFALPFFSQFPELRFILAPLMPLFAIYRGIPFVGLIVFFALFLLVVRNESMPHFIRFNTMQAILLSIVVFLCQIIIDMALAPVLGGGLLVATLYNVVFLGVWGTVIYSVVQSARGLYAEIPTLSDAVHMQVR